MKPMALGLFCVALLSGCATAPSGEGRYLQAYSDNLVFMELDGRTNRGCRELSKDYRKNFENTKGVDIVCSSTSVGGALPVSMSFIQEGMGAVLTGRVLTIEACNTMKNELVKQNNPKHSLSCKQGGG